MALSKILPASQASFFGARNLLHNGKFAISQRGTSFASVASGGNRYTCDRWGAPRRTKVDRSTDAPTGFDFSLLLDGEQTFGSEGFTLLQGIEAVNITQAGSYTLSFYAKSPDITTLNINVRDKTGVGEGGTTHSSFVTNQAVTISSSFARYTHTFTISNPDLTGTCLEVGIGNTSASQNDTFFITGLQLEFGPLTDFEHEDFGTTLSKCQRFFQFGNGVATGKANGGTMGGFGAFKEEMRSTPTITAVSQIGAHYSGTVSYTTPSTIGTFITSSVNGTGNNAYAQVSFSAEAEL